MKKFAKEHEIKYIFFEKLVSPRFSETLAHEVGAQTLVLDPLEGVPTEDIQKGVNYFTVMEQNLTNLKTSLECQ
jgi:zinc transport system substrate-binding protein